MNAVNGILLIHVPLMTVVAGAIAAVVLGRNGGITHALGANGLRTPGSRMAVRLALGGAWLVLTVLTMWCVFLGGLVVVQVLLFGLGRAFAAAGLLTLAAAMISIPIIWALAILRSSGRV